MRISDWSSDVCASDLISFGALFSDQEASLWEQVSEELMSLRPVLDLVAPMTARDGSLRHVSWTIVPEDADKDDASIFAVWRDVTDDLLAKEKLKEAEGQIHKMKKIEMIGQMKGGAAQAFKNIW